MKIREPHAVGKMYLHNELARGIKHMSKRSVLCIWRESIVPPPGSRNSSWNPVCQTCLMHANSSLGAKPGLAEKEHLISSPPFRAGRTAVIIHGISKAPAVLTLLPDGGCINAESVLSFLCPSTESRKLGNWAPPTQLWEHRALLFTFSVPYWFIRHVFLATHIQTSYSNTGTLLSRENLKSEIKTTLLETWAELNFPAWKLDEYAHIHVFHFCSGYL